MATVTVVYGSHAFDVTIDDEAPLSFYIDQCARQLGLPRKWREECYAPGVDFVATVTADCSVTLYNFFSVKVHFNGKKIKVRCGHGNTALVIVEAALSELRLPSDWKEHVSIERGLGWESQFTGPGEIFLKDPRRQR